MQTEFICEAIPTARRMRTFDCQACARPFQSAQSKASYCSRACAEPARIAKAHATRSANAMAKRQRCCQRCGSAFTIANPSGQARAGKSQEGQFCSRKCHADSQRIYANKTEAKRAEHLRRNARLGIQPVVVPETASCSVCNQAFKPKSGRSRFCSKRCLYVASDPVDRTPRQCRECNDTFIPVLGDNRQGYCSKRCSRRKANRIGWAARDARKRGATVERVDPIEVFERDAWRCYICRAPTPRRLRGTLDPRAPELDHIIPLSAGGAHSYLNTACSCRTCNQAKGAAVFGQLRLFG